MTQVAQSPWDVAANPPPPPEYKNEYWGELWIDANFITLVKGAPGGRVPWDDSMEGQLNPSTGKPMSRLTEVKISLAPLADTGLQFTVDRDYIAEFKPWTDITFPSLKALGVMDLPSLQGKFGWVEMIKTGETYTSNKTGKLVEKDTFKFLGIYEDETACKAAYMAAKNGTAPTTTTPPTQAANNGANGEKDVAWRFLQRYIKSACEATPGDLAAIRQSLTATIAGQPLLSKHFTVDSPEVVEAIAANLG